MSIANRQTLVAFGMALVIALLRRYFPTSDISFACAIVIFTLGSIVFIYLEHVKRKNNGA